MGLIAAGTMVASGRVRRPGWVETSGGHIAACEFPDGTLVPGFVDMHVHGGGGASYTEPDGIAKAAAFHLRHGTTTTMASLVTGSPAELLGGVRALAEIRMVTLAPELPGADAAIRRFADAGVVVAVGHTNADYRQTRHAIALGATVGTHLFNAMPPLHHREPGPALALLRDPRVTVELIADGVHVHPDVVHAVIDADGPERVALVTDALARRRVPAGPGAHRRRRRRSRGCTGRRRSRAAPPPWTGSFAPWPGQAPTATPRSRPRCR